MSDLPAWFQGDALEWAQRAARQLKQPPNPPARRQPRVARLQSPRQRRAESQTKNEIRAVYGTESKWNRTPEAPEGVELHRNVGPSDLPKNDPGVGAKPTQSATGIGRYDRPKQQRTGGGTKKKTAEDWAKFAEQYDI